MLGKLQRRQNACQSKLMFVFQLLNFEVDNDRNISTLLFHWNPSSDLVAEKHRKSQTHFNKHELNSVKSESIV